MTVTLSAAKRTKLGRQAKQELAASRVPAVIYGRSVEPSPISVPRSEFIKVMRAAGYSSLVDLTIESQPMVKVLIKEVQYNPLTSQPRHIDLYQVNMNEEITARIPLKFVG